MSENFKHLPVYPHLDEICQSVQASQVTILTATPGSGKTLLVAPHLLKNTDLRIAMLEPRRVAAQLSAQAIAQFNGWSLGKEVGLVMRKVNKRSDRTRLTIMTEGVLSRMLASGDAEKNFDLIILDEFHERSIHTDLACAWAKQQNKVKLLLMSATLDTTPLLEYFKEATVMNIKGRNFPIENHYLKRTLNFHDRAELSRKTVETCKRALESKADGNILVFLPGSRDILRAKEGLEIEGIDKEYNVEVHTLYSKASKEQHRQALNEDSQRKIILATNIAETSLTIPNVNTVIDSGLQKESNYNGQTGVKSLALRRIALDSATQRAGRAGRLGPGTCYKLWTKADEQRFRSTTPAEIHRMDPTEFLLKVMSFGESVESFDFFEAPDQDNLALAKRRLDLSGCVQEGQLTELGQWVCQFPGDFSCGLLAAVSRAKKYFDEALLTIVILQEGDPAPFLSNDHVHSQDDLRSRLSWLKDKPEHPYRASAKKIKQQINAMPPLSLNFEELNSLEEALVFSFPHRLCRFRQGKKKKALMSTGRGVKVEKGRTAKNAEFFIALELLDHQIHNQPESEANFLYDVSKKSIKTVFKDHIKKTTKVESSKKKEVPKAFVFQSFWDLSLEEPRGLPLEKKHVVEHLKKLFQEDWKKALDEYPRSLEFVERVLFCEKHNPEMGFPDFSGEYWDLVVEAAFSDKKDLSIEDKECLQSIQLLLTADQMEFIKSFAPESIPTKIRKNNSISYADPLRPMVSIILQEAFEFKESPMIGNGRVTLAIELLAPSRRPIEVSLDMARFWAKSYPEIRKQYRGRYPKHSWPESL